MRWSWMAAAMLGLFGTSYLWADLAPRPRPPVKPAQEATIVVEVDANATAPRLLIPSKIVVRKAELDDVLRDRFADNEPGRPWGQTMLAGSALALAVSCAGLWMVRRGKSNKIPVLILAVGSVLAGTALVWANAGPPLRPKPNANQEIFSGKITVESVQEGDTVKLIVPPDIVATMAKGMVKAGGAGAAPPPKTPEKPD